MIRLFFRFIALVFMVFVMIIGFGWWDDQARHVFGWLGLSFVFLILAWVPFPDRPIGRAEP